MKNGACGPQSSLHISHLPKVSSPVSVCCLPLQSWKQEFGKNHSGGKKKASRKPLTVFR